MSKYEGFGTLEGSDPDDTPSFERTNVKIDPIGDVSPKDVEEMLYLVLRQTCYALRALDTPNGGKVIALCKMRPLANNAFAFEVVRVMLEIIPEYTKEQPEPKGIRMPTASGKDMIDLFHSSGIFVK